MRVNPLAYVIDDDPDIRASIEMLLRSVSIDVEAFGSAKRFLDSFDDATDRPKILLLDVRMAEISGMTVLEQLRSAHPRLPVIMISGHGDIDMAVQAMKLGAKDFVTKPFNAQDLLDRVQGVIRKSADAHAVDDRVAEGKSRLEQLTPRERDVFDRLVQGDANKLIAIDLGISIRTVEAHRAKVMEKLGARTLVDLVKIALP